MFRSRPFRSVIALTNAPWDGAPAVGWDVGRPHEAAVDPIRSRQVHVDSAAGAAPRGAREDGAWLRSSRVI